MKRENRKPLSLSLFFSLAFTGSENERRHVCEKFFKPEFHLKDDEAKTDLPTLSRRNFFSIRKFPKKNFFFYFSTSLATNLLLRSYFNGKTKESQSHLKKHSTVKSITVPLLFSKSYFCPSLLKLLYR